MTSQETDYYLSVHKYEILESIAQRLEDKTSQFNFLLEQIQEKEYSNIELSKKEIIEENNQIIADIEYMNRLLKIDYRKY